MTCAEFQAFCQTFWRAAAPLNSESTLQSAPACSDLVADLNAISQQAELLQASEEPSPRVWNSIEIALRQEGLIREPELEQPWRPSSFTPLDRGVVAAGDGRFPRDFGTASLRTPGSVTAEVAEQLCRCVRGCQRYDYRVPGHCGNFSRSE